MGALYARPWPHPEKLCMDQGPGGQTLECGIDPAIERNVRGPLIPLRVRSIAAKDLADRSPFPAAEIGVVMTAVNVLRDEVADHGTNDHIRGKMLLGAHARNVDQRSQTVGHDFH